MNNQSNPLLIVVIAAILLFAGYYFFTSEAPVINQGDSEVIDSSNQEVIGAGVTTPVSNKTSNQTSDAVTSLRTIDSDGAYLVYYTDDGFVPETLQVRQGTTVRFVNNSERSMRIFSDVQNNVMFDELNQNKTVGEGGTYEFMFTRKGIWFYENYNKKTDKANIVVY